METSSLLLLLNADILQSKRAWNKANLAALLNQPSYPPVVIVFLEHRKVTGFSSKRSASETPLLCYPPSLTPHWSMKPDPRWRPDAGRSVWISVKLRGAWQYCEVWCLLCSRTAESGVICGSIGFFPNCPSTSCSDSSSNVTNQGAECDSDLTRRTNFWWTKATKLPNSGHIKQSSTKITPSDHHQNHQYRFLMNFNSLHQRSPPLPFSLPPFQVLAQMLLTSYPFAKTLCGGKALQTPF